VTRIRHTPLTGWVRLFLLGLVVGAPVVSASHPVALTPSLGPRLVRASDTGLMLEWIAPPVQVRATSDGTCRLKAGDYPLTQQPGTPRLPYTTALIAIPGGSAPRLSIESADTSVRPLRAPLAVAPRPDGILRDAYGQPTGGTHSAAAASPDTWPAEPATLEEVGLMRGVQLARITFYPAIPEGSSLRVTRRLRVQVVWEAAAQEGIASAQFDPMTAAVQRAIINPWDVAPRPNPRDASTRHTAVVSPTAYIEVESSGIHEMMYDDLEPLGFAGTNPQNVRLFRNGEEIAYEWVGDTDTVFEEEEGLRFYAVHRFSRWTTVDVYRLVAESGPRQKKILDRPAYPLGLDTGIPWVERVYEENHIYTPDSFSGHLPAGRDGDRWMWQRLLYPDGDPGPPDLSSTSFTVQVPAVDTSQDAELTLWFVSRTDVAAGPDHRVDVSLNGTPLGRVEWDGRAAITATLPITAGMLYIGQNTLALSLPGIPGVAVEETWIDGFAVRHARSLLMADTSVRFSSVITARQAYTVAVAGSAPFRAYDITQPTQPQRLAFVEIEGNSIIMGDPEEGYPRDYLVASTEGILTPTRVRGPEDPWAYNGGTAPNGADLIVITHPDFAGEMDPLVSLRRSQAISTTVVNVLGIYDAWGDGRRDPEAIRSFVAEAYGTWTTQPLYVLLVGDGSYDPKLHDPESTLTYIPPYLADIDPWAGETAADNRFVCVDGSDALPDLLLGRFPVKSAAETRAMVQKTLEYETRSYPGGWNDDVVLVADDRDAAGDFGNSSDTYAAVHVSDPFTVTRTYCAGTSPDQSDCSAGDTDTLHENLTGEWHQGARLIQFTGHASWQQWGTERFFHLDDAPSLGNRRRYPVILGMTCFTSAFHRPEPTLDETLLTTPGGGAVATWGPTGLGVGTGHDDLSNGFFVAVFDDEVETLGEAALAGKVELAGSGLNADLLDTFSLLGDPSLRVDLAITPWANVYVPVVQSGQ
jgi:hypothetical protein